MAGGVALMLLATAMVASAYHIPNPSDARSWINPAGTGNAIVACEVHDADPMAPPQTEQGVGGLCYASCEHFPDTPEGKNATKAKKSEIQTTWCAIEPQCEGVIGLPVSPVTDCEPGGGLAGEQEKPSDNVNGTGDWFMRAGSNTRSCTGEWHQAAVFKQALLYYGGTDPNDNGISGHATFFVNEPNTVGSYSFLKTTVNPIDNEKTYGEDVDEDGDKTGDADDNCTGNDVGLCDVDQATKVGKTFTTCD